VFSRVLLAIDDASAAEALAGATMAVTRPATTAVTVLSVQSAPSEGLTSRQVALSRPEAPAEPAKATRALREGGYGVDVVVRQRQHGSVADDILDQVDESLPDLIVIGSRGLSDFQALLVGSVSHRILAEAVCPVLVVRDQAPVAAVRRILLAYDGSHHARRAAEVAAAVAHLDQATIEIVQVSQFTVVEGAYLVDSAQDFIRAELAALATRLGDRAKADWRVVSAASGRAQAIAGVAEELDSDLIVMGSRGLSRIAGAVIGSVSHEVIHRTHRLVLLVP
jgi:nucleotide-binding universal stress UspA family protein